MHTISKNTFTIRLKNLKYTVMVIILFAFIACNIHEQPIDLFFADIDKKLTKEDKDKLDSCQTIDCWMSFVRMGRAKKLLVLFDSMPQSVSCLLDSNKILKYRYVSLFVAYCKNRNGQEYNLPAIEDEIENYNTKEKIRADDFFKNQESTLKKIAELNYGSIHVRDTIMLRSPTRVTQGVSKIFYWNPNDVGKVPEISALVLYKNKVDWHTLSIIKILDTNNKKVKIDSVYLNVGDTLEVDFYYYGQEIDTI